MTLTKPLQITRCSTPHCPTHASYDGLCYLCYFAPVEYTYDEPSKRIALWAVLFCVSVGATFYWFAK